MSVAYEDWLDGVVEANDLAVAFTAPTAATPFHVVTVSGPDFLAAWGDRDRDNACEQMLYALQARDTLPGCAVCLGALVAPADAFFGAVLAPCPECTGVELGSSSSDRTRSDHAVSAAFARSLK